MLKISSYYSPSVEPEPFWTLARNIEQFLPITIAKVFQSTINLIAITEEKYITVNDFYDISYCKIFSIPDKRPAKFIYTFLTQYIGSEGKVRTWIRKTKPNLIYCFKDIPQDLVFYGNVLKCKMELLPNLETEDSRIKAAQEILDYYGKLKF